MLRKISIVLIFVFLSISLFSSCIQESIEEDTYSEQEQSSTDDTKQISEIEDSKTVQAGEEAIETSKDESKGEERTVIDNAGNSINVPAVEDIKNVAIISPPLLSLYYAIVGNLDKVVAATPTAIDSGKNGVFFDIAPELKNVDIEVLKSNDINAEEFLKLKPDIGLYYAPQQGKIFNEVVVPGLSFMTDQIYDPFQTIKDWASLMSEVMGTESEGEEMIAYGERVLSDVREKSKEIDDSEKLKGMMIHTYSNGKMSVGGSEFYADFWLTESGLINVASETVRPTQVDMEQIYEWDPDIIFIWKGPSAQDIIDNKVEGHDWSNVSAVKNKKVYTIPCGLFAWYPVGSDVSLMIKWVAQKAYPDVYNYDLTADTFDYYQKIYDYDLSKVQLSKILDTK